MHSIKWLQVDGLTDGFNDLPSERMDQLIGGRSVRFLIDDEERVYVVVGDYLDEVTIVEQWRPK